MEYEIVIGLEVHVQLKTQTKMFCNCPTTFGAEPNSQVCPVCTGQPGVLPVVNRKAVELAGRAAVALNCSISGFTKFDRKNYFYPDLPKNYQISQYDRPFAVAGHLAITLTDGSRKKIGIIRAHLEEDAGKLVHPEIKNDTEEEKYPSSAGTQRMNFSLVDLNRCGIPLLEIVSAPDLRAPEEAYSYLTSLKSILQYIDVSDCDMEKGSLRCDANISVRPKGETKFGTKTELKNLNSFKFLSKALAYEARRQMELLDRGERVRQQTLLWDQNSEITLPMRSKEEAHDYRYFPEPDLVPLKIAPEWADAIRASLPELPDARRQRFINAYNLPHYDADVLTQDKSVADFFEETLSYFNRPKAVANWMMGEVLKAVNERKARITDLKLTPKALAELVKLFEAGTITSRAAKEVFAEMLVTGKNPTIIVSEKNLAQVSDTGQIEAAARQAVKDNPKPVDDYKKGKKTAIQALVGAVMKQTRGRANPQLVMELLTKILNEN